MEVKDLLDLVGTSYAKLLTIPDGGVTASGDPRPSGNADRGRGHPQLCSRLVTDYEICVGYRWGHILHQGI